MKIIFNAETLIGIASKTPSRSGIFFTAFSLLEEFKRNHQVLLYTDHKSWAIINASALSKEHEIIEPQNKLAKLISYGYLVRNKLDLYRRYWLVKFLCKSITFSVLLVDKIVLKTIKYDEVSADAFFSAHSCRCHSAFAKLPKFTLLHDVIPILDLGFCLDTTRFYFETQIAQMLSKDDYYFTNSNYTKQDFLKHFPNALDPHKIKVTLLGASQRFYDDFDIEKNQRIKEKYKIPQDKKYIFSLCTLEPRKNLLFVIDNFLSMVEKEGIEDLVFVLGGGARDGFLREIQKHLRRETFKVIHIGYVDDEDLSNLFSHSLCSVYLSLYEGFGLPVLEAMQCGCPVIASNTTSIPEVAGEAGILIDPCDSQALQEAFKKLYDSPKLREELKQKGLERAKGFSWNKCAQEMLEKMEEVCKI